MVATSASTASSGKPPAVIHRWPCGPSRQDEQRSQQGHSFPARPPLGVRGAKLSGHRLAVRVHSARDLGMGRSGGNPRTHPIPGAERCEPQQLGLDTITYGERREFVCAS
jgi:hypothetical protein